MSHGKSLHTRVVHAGVEDNEYGAVVPPIVQTSTFRFRDADHGAALFAGREKGYIYTRIANPTVQALERAVADLEGGVEGFACASGMAAIHMAFSAFLEAGDEIICSESVYGPVTSLLNEHWSRWGVKPIFVDTSNLADLEAALTEKTKIVHVETPGNPTLCVTDLKAAAKLAHGVGAILTVDNTFLSPVLQRPLEHGADVVIHSLTKFLNGHADVIGGIIVAKDADQAKMLRKTVVTLGAVLPPMEAFLVHRGIKTLALRMERHCASAQVVAEYLEGHAAVEWVAFPGLPSHPQYELSRRQADGPGGLISFGLKGGLAAGKALMNTMQLAQIAVSLGGVETLVQHPASMTHSGMTPELREQAGIGEGLVRISVGIEEVGEVIADLEQALAKLPAAHVGSGT